MITTDRSSQLAKLHTQMYFLSLVTFVEDLRHLEYACKPANHIKLQKFMNIFFFLIGKRNLLREEKTPSRCIEHAPRRKRDYNRLLAETIVKSKETTKLARETSGVKPQTRAQSKRRPKNNSESLVFEWSSSSKITEKVDRISLLVSIFYQKIQH